MQSTAAYQQQNNTSATEGESPLPSLTKNFSSTYLVQQPNVVTDSGSKAYPARNVNANSKIGQLKRNQLQRISTTSCEQREVLRPQNYPKQKSPIVQRRNNHSAMQTQHPNAKSSTLLPTASYDGKFTTAEMRHHQSLANYPQQARELQLQTEMQRPLIKSYQ